MPRNYLMNWDGEPNFRWRKMYKGLKYVVTCEELQAMVWTKEASGKLADDWWREKQAEIDGVNVERERRAQALLEEREWFRSQPIQDVLRRAFDVNELVCRVEDGEDPADMPEIDAVVPAVDNTLKTAAEAWLTLIQGEIKPLSYREIRSFIRSLYTVPALRGVDAKDINESVVEKAYLWLKALDIEANTKKKRWGIFCRFVKYLWSKRLCELPRNLETLAFKSQVKAIKVHPLETVRAVLGDLKSRLQLYALLGLNCGMTSADIGQLTKDMVDIKMGTLTRKRVKTASHENVPTVTYTLWPETLALLSEHWSSHPTLALVSEDGTALWETRQEGDKTPVKDLIYQQFKRAKVSITIKEFRSIAATEIEKHDSYGRYVPHFLGHSPKTVADKHYRAPSEELFAEILNWLHGRLWPVAASRRPVPDADE